MATYQQVGGLYQVPLVDFGKALQKQGWTVKEHSAFGGVTPGVHSEKGHHPHDEALDITWWKSDTDPTGTMGWKDYTINLGERLGQLKGAGGQYLQALHPGNEPKGHGTHAHLGVTGGVLALTPQQMQDFGIANVTTPTTTTTTTPTTTQVQQDINKQQSPINIFIQEPQQQQEQQISPAQSLLKTFISDRSLGKKRPSVKPAFDNIGILAKAAAKTYDFE